MIFNRKQSKGKDTRYEKKRFYMKARKKVGCGNSWQMLLGERQHVFLIKTPPLGSRNMGSPAASPVDQ